MLSSIKALFLTTLMVAASVSAAPSADVNGISRREDAPLVTLLGSELNVLNTAQPEAAQATCRGANAFKEGSGCVGRGGQFACSLNCFDIIVCGRGVWQLSAKCNQPSCRATQVNGTPGCA